MVGIDKSIGFGEDKDEISRELKVNLCVKRMKLISIKNKAMEEDDWRKWRRAEISVHTTNGGERLKWILWLQKWTEDAIGFLKFTLVDEKPIGRGNETT